MLWPNRSGLPADARPAKQGRGPLKTSADINGHARAVLRFDGEALLELPRKVPATGSLFVVFRTADTGSPSQRLLGWEDSDAGKHGLGLMPDPKGGCTRSCGTTASRAIWSIARRPRVSSSSASPGVREARRCTATGRRPARKRGSTTSRPTRALRPCDWEGLAPGAARASVATSRRFAFTTGNWTNTSAGSSRPNCAPPGSTPLDPKTPASDPLAELYDELLSARGPFWLAADARRAMLPAAERSQAGRPRPGAGRLEEEAPGRDSPGGRRAGWRSQGHAPRGIQGFPRLSPRQSQAARQDRAARRSRVLLGEGQPQVRIKEGSGRRELAEWLVRPDNPLTARVMVNRIWQHHFGEGLVRTPNDFGARGERPTNPELLDWLAARFVESGWSVKAMHRLIMLSSAYQQSSQAERRWRWPRTRRTACSGG